MRKYFVKMIKILKFSLFVVFIFIAFSCSFVSSGSQNQDIKKYKIEQDSFIYIHELAKYADTSKLKRFEREILRFEKLDSAQKQISESVLFIGSSSIRKWKSLKYDMFPVPVINRGFGGSTIAEVIYYTHRIILPYRPNRIVLYAGENDLTLESTSPSDVLETFKIFRKMIKFYLPQTEIYFVSIKPSLARAELWNKMEITNFLIKRYTETQQKIFFIDVSSSMLTINGEIRDDIFVKDKLHLNEKGYKIWTKKIKPYLID